MEPFKQKILEFNDYDSRLCKIKSQSYRNYRSEDKFSLSGNKFIIQYSLNLKPISSNKNLNIRFQKKIKWLNKPIDFIDNKDQNIPKQNNQQKRTIVVSKNLQTSLEELNKQDQIKQSSEKPEYLNKQQLTNNFLEVFDTKIQEILQKIPENQKDYFLQLIKNNIEYFQHFLEMCKCFLCKCGLCKCTFIRRCIIQILENLNIKLIQQNFSQYQQDFRDIQILSNILNNLPQNRQKIDNLTHHSSSRDLYISQNTKKPINVINLQKPVLTLPSAITSHNMISKLSSYSTHHLNYFAEQDRAVVQPVNQIPNNSSLKSFSVASSYQTDFVQFPISERKTFYKQSRNNPIGPTFSVQEKSNNQYFYETPTNSQQHYKVQILIQDKYFNQRDHCFRYFSQNLGMTISTQQSDQKVQNVIDCQSEPDIHLRKALYNRINNQILK